jgi:transposase-like protein
MTSDTPYPLTPPPQNPSLSSFHPYFNPSENTRTTTNQVQIKRIQQTKRPVRSLRLSEKIDFDDITVAELKEALKKRGLSVAGRKAELIHRLRQVSSPSFCVNRHPSPNKRSPRSFEPYQFISSAPFNLYLNDSYIKKQVPQTNRKGISTRSIPYSHLLHL